MTTETWWSQGHGLVDKDDMHRFMRDCILKAGAPEDHAVQLADVLIFADYRGRFSEGLNRLELHLKLLKRRQCDPCALPVVLKDAAATAWVDGRNGMGPVVANFCMNLAIEKAKRRGIGWVTAKRSNDYGIGSYYTTQAIQEGLIGFICSNAAPVLSPIHSKESFLGSNPLSFAAPAQYTDSFVLDATCSAVSLAKVELMRRTQSRLPRGWALNELGGGTTCPVEASRSRKLLPLGAESSGASKGFGLALMVEALCGVLAGGPSGSKVVDWHGKSELPVRLSQSFMAIDPKCFGPNFEQCLYQTMYRMRGMVPKDLKKRILVPGDPERSHMKKVRNDGGITYHSNLLKHALVLAEFLEVEPMTIK